MADDPTVVPPADPVSDPAADPVPPSDGTGSAPVTTPAPVFTYGDPAQSPLWELRFIIGDTVEKTAFLTDAELNYLITANYGDLADAAVDAIIKIMAKLARLCDETVGSVSKSWSQMRDGYKDLLTDLRRIASSSGGMPFVGGVSRTQNRMPYTNRDTVRPQFGTRMMSGRRGFGLCVPGVIDDAPEGGTFGDG